MPVPGDDGSRPRWHLSPPYPYRRPALPSARDGREMNLVTYDIAGKFPRSSVMGEAVGGDRRSDGNELDREGQRSFPVADAE
ncbi:hypothetical protein SSPO_031400 [Streptomyces antimycoticus]|uniref:Uncharacterized protein n=1 Tax=Streptomyces antimycoticus TaxID=68175 RepID=A0A499UI89_9ACTN|nr:hypothetical protein SSPO_031400 [Streptomyces antimycoticus]